LFSKDILNRYQTFLLDVWGVLYDGNIVYPKALKILEQLSNKEVILLSNTTYLKCQLATKLNKLGITNTKYKTIVTSGQLVYDKLNKIIPQNLKKYFYLGPEETMGIINRNYFSNVSKVADADFILINDAGNLQQNIGLLQQALAYNLPAICTNPDISVKSLKGKYKYCAGYLAKIYSKMGGDVTYIGKPYPTIYQHALQYTTYERKYIIAVGDTPATDIDGANKFGLASLLVNHTLDKKSKIQPTYSIENFTG
jgi:HAD superfamily hydrolase (TIGR01459 family)